MRDPHRLDASEARTNFRMTVRYDGRAYRGWQRNRDTPTVQGALERALEATFGVPCRAAGSGRTDRGAHAEGQVASARLPAPGDLADALDRLNANLPDDIRALDLSPVDDGFHARESAVAKRYRYEIWNAARCPDDLAGLVWHVREPLDVDAMREACTVLTGSHDFASFASPAKHARRSTVRDLSSLTLEHEPPRVRMTFTADGFLYKMVRNLVRAIVRVGEGRGTPASLRRILESRDRGASPGSAPASGLYLDAVYYESAP